jgi:alanyl-tRNA synthetase
MTFMVADGIMPSNEGRGYVLRRIIRRAVRFARLIGIKDEFLSKVVQVVVDQMKEAYPELAEKRDYIIKIISLEEKRFQATLELGLNLLGELLDRLEKEGKTVLPGGEVFRLYDTYGFPKELTEEIAQERGFEIDSEGFEEALNQQREKARRAHGENYYVKEDQAFYNSIAPDYRSSFVGYDHLKYTTKIIGLIKDNDLVDELTGSGIVMLAETPFYAEKGGQVTDIGTITAKGGKAQVREVKTPAENFIIHFVEVGEGLLRVGDEVECQVDDTRRVSTARNHTATHLLHKALKEVLGDHVNQAGSLVEPERLRFDFTHYEAPTKEQLRKIEQIVNANIRKNLPVIVEIKDLDEAKELGATALFDEKYGDKVRVVQIADYSKELCGGTHVQATGEIGLIKIVSEGSIAAGIRRIEAVTGERAVYEFEKLEDLVESLAKSLKVSVPELPQKIEKIEKEQAELRKELEALQAKMAAQRSRDLLQDFQDASGVPYKAVDLGSIDVKSLRSLGDAVKDKLDGVLVLAGANDGKAVLLCLVSDNYVKKGIHAGKLVKELAAAVGGSGGGRPDSAQAGGSSPEKIGDALLLLPQLISSQLS